MEKVIRFYEHDRSDFIRELATTAFISNRKLLLRLRDNSNAPSYESRDEKIIVWAIELIAWGLRVLGFILDGNSESSSGSRWYK